MPLAPLHQRLLRQHTPATMVVDRHDRVLHQSAGAGRYLLAGQDAERATGTPLPAALRPPLGEALAGALARARQTGQRVATGLVRLADEHGRERAVHMRALPDQQQPGGDGPLLVEFAEAESNTGLSDRPPHPHPRSPAQAVARATDDLDQRLRLVADSTRDYAIVTMDEAGLVTSWNKGAEAMFGHTEPQALGQHFRLLFTPEDRASGQPERELATALQDGRALDERWHLRRDGSRLYCSGITTPLLDVPHSGFAKIARDLTERQLLDRQRDELLRAEQQVRAQLEAASALRSEFLAVMSHELKNPLNVVQINAELIRRSPQALAHEPLARAAETIRKTVQGQAQIIDDLLDLSRLETGKLSLERTAVAYVPVIERIVDALRAQAAEKSIQLTVQAQDVVVQADIVRLEQIVWNLASNAVRYTQPGGKVTITLAREGVLARLDVADNGPGIAPDFIDSMFNMFEQGDRSPSTRREGGLGIGLALVKQLTDLHGGHVEAHSDGPGQGATFTVWLPMCEAAAERGAEPGAGDGELAGRRVLLVEDNLDTLEVLAELLRLEGAEVVTASAAAQALALADAQDFDLVVSDIAMPGMDGHQLMQALRLRERCRDWPAIAVTGFGRAADAERALAAGFQAHIPKPLSLAALLQTARPLLGLRP